MKSIRRADELAKIFLVYLRALEESRMLMRTPGIVMPFVLFAGLQCVVLFSLTFFAVTPLDAVMVPVLRALGGESALHYPMHFVLLPGIYHRVYLPLVVTIGFVLYGYAVFNIGDHYQRSGARIPDRPDFRSMIPAIVLIGAIYVVSATVVPMVVSALSSSANKGTTTLLMSFMGVAGGAVIQVFIVYALLFLRTRTRKPFAALKESARFARRHFLVTALVLGTVILIHQPIDYLMSHPDKVVLKFRPELVFYVLLGGIIIETLTSYLLLAATASIALSRREGVV